MVAFFPATKRIALIAFSLMALTGYQSSPSPGQTSSDRAPLYFYVAVDNSVSYGLPKNGDRLGKAQDVFYAAKKALNREIRVQGVFQEGDRLVGISPFTDEQKQNLENYLGGPIVIHSSELQNVQMLVMEMLEKIQLRPFRRGADYKTYYRNILDYARDDFQKVGATPDQQVVILLTDERGDEFEGAAEVSLEDYSSFYIVKLTAKAVGNGALAITANKTLAGLTTQNDTSVLSYVVAMRNRYRSLRPPTEEKPGLSTTTVIVILVPVIVILGTGWVAGTRLLGRDLRGRRKDPKLHASYNPGIGKILLQAEQFELPNEPDKYWLDKGGELKDLSPEGGWIEPADSLPPGSYEITVQPESGPPISGSFMVGESNKGEPSLRATYKASSRIVFLKPYDCQLPESKHRYELDEGFEIEGVNVATGEVMLPRPLQAGRHIITVHLEDGLPVKAAFDAGPPPPPTPKYSLSVARYSDIGNPRTVELTDREINLLDKEGLRASVWVKKDEHYLNIRTAGNVQREDGTPIIGNLQLALGTVTNNPILLALEDDGDDIEITVQKS